MAVRPPRRHGLRSSTSTWARSATGRAAGLVYSGYTDLAGKDEVYALIENCVEEVNAEAGREGGRRIRNAPLPGPAQGAGSRRRRADPHRRCGAASSPRSTRRSSMRFTPTRPCSSSRRRCGSRMAAPAGRCRPGDRRRPPSAHVRQGGVMVSKDRGRDPRSRQHLAAFGGVKALTDISASTCASTRSGAIIGPNGRQELDAQRHQRRLPPQEGTITFRGEQRRDMDTTRPPPAASRAPSRTSRCSPA